jgi:two-component system, chemotaxis family, chemotaxis protein CheY
MQKHKVIIVEDNKTEALALKLAFSGLKNIECIYVPDGEGLLKNLETNPSFIILDLFLPDIMGVELIKKIKQYDPTIEIVVVSAQEDISVVAKVQEEGVFNYVVKSESCLIYLKKTIENLLLVLEKRG